MIKTAASILGSFSMGLILAGGFGLLFLDWLDRPLLDRLILLILPAAAVACLILLLPETARRWLRDRPDSIRKIRPIDLRGALQRNAGGLILALVFFCVYTWIGLKLNLPNQDTVDNFLDADNTAWILRIAAPSGGGMEMRGPHPFAYFILRPPGRMLALLTGDAVLSAILLNTLCGGLVVYLTWLYILRATSHRTHALLMGSLSGLCTAHLVLGSVVESYIFSAASLLIFLVLLQRRGRDEAPLVAAGLLTFGITLTNFAQNLAAFIVDRPRLREVVRFTLITLSAAVILSLVHAARYPSSRLFFLPSDAGGEREFAISILGEPSWRALGRVQLLARTFLLYSIIAPQPYVFVEEVGGVFPRFNFFRIVPGTYSFSAYSGIGTWVVLIWGILLAAAGVLFLRDLFRRQTVDVRLALVLCLAGNFVLHLNYGYEPFLYSPDWTYALILFTGLSLQPHAGSRILQAALTGFLLLLAYNQAQFIRFILETIAPYV